MLHKEIKAKSEMKIQEDKSSSNWQEPLSDWFLQVAKSYGLTQAGLIQPKHLQNLGT